MTTYYKITQDKTVNITEQYFYIMQYIHFSHNITSVHLMESSHSTSGRAPWKAASHTIQLGSGLKGCSIRGTSAHQLRAGAFGRRFWGFPKAKGWVAKATHRTIRMSWTELRFGTLVPISISTTQAILGGRWRFWAFACVCLFSAIVWLGFGEHNLKAKNLRLWCNTQLRCRFHK